MSLLALSACGIEHNSKTEICYKCDPHSDLPFVEAELIEQPEEIDNDWCTYIDLESGLEIWISDDQPNI